MNTLEKDIVHLLVRRDAHGVGKRERGREGRQAGRGRETDRLEGRDEERRRDNEIELVELVRKEEIWRSEDKDMKSRCQRKRETRKN